MATSAWRYQPPQYANPEQGLQGGAGYWNHQTTGPYTGSGMWDQWTAPDSGQTYLGQVKSGGIEGNLYSDPAGQYWNQGQQLPWDKATADANISGYQEAARQSLASDANSFDTRFGKMVPGIIGAAALAGMGGFLPGTESIFGGAGAGAMSEGAGYAAGGDFFGSGSAGLGAGGLGDAVMGYDLAGAGAGAGAMDTAGFEGLAAADMAGAGAGGLDALSPFQAALQAQAGGGVPVVDPLSGGLFPTGTGSTVGGGLSSAALPSTDALGGASTAATTGAPASAAQTAQAGTAAANPAAKGNWLTNGLKTLGITNDKGNLGAGTAMSALGLGMNAFNQSKNNKAIGNMQQKVSDTVGQLGPVQQELIAKYHKGGVPEADQARINEWVTQATAQMRQQYANSGLGNSSMAKQAEASIHQKAVQMANDAEAKAIQAYLSQALATTGAITGPYAQIGNQQIQQDAGLQASIAKLFGAIGSSQASAGAPAQAGAK